MKMIEISKEKFEEFANKNSYSNYCQTANYGMVMSETGFDYSFVAYTTNDLEIISKYPLNISFYNHRSVGRFLSLMVLSLH